MMKFSELEISDIFKYKDVVLLKISSQILNGVKINTEILWEEGRKNLTLYEKFRYCLPADVEVEKIGCIDRNFSRLISEWFLNK